MTESYYWFDEFDNNLQTNVPDSDVDFTIFLLFILSIAVGYFIYKLSIFGRK